MVHDAIRDALFTKPEGVCWFWFNGTFCPVLHTDPDSGGEDLFQRWYRWREEYQAGKLLSCLEIFSKANA